MIENVKTHERFIELVKEANNRYRPVVTNCYLQRDAIDRLIDRGDMYACRQNKGIVFLADEKEFYEGYYYLNPEAEIDDMPENKLILVQNMYREGQKNERLSKIESKLKAAGFIQAETSYQIQANKKDVEERLKKVLENASAYLGNGYRITVPDRSLLPQIRELQMRITEMPKYKFYWFTDDELMSDADKGKLICAVTDEGKVVAAEHGHGNGMRWIAVEPDYRMKIGLAAELSYRILLTEETEIVRGWIRMDNTASLNYHRRMGYVTTSTRKDVWLLEQ